MVLVMQFKNKSPNLRFKTPFFMLMDNLPGRESQLKMAPEMRREELENAGSAPEAAVSSAVLLLLYPPAEAQDPILPEDKEREIYISNDWEILLIERSVSEGVHSGQIALPGGKTEPEERSAEETAKRETLEEVGIDPKHCKVLGELTSLYIPVSNYIIHPVLALSDGTEPGPVNEREVASWMRVPLWALAPERVEIIEARRPGGQILRAPAYKYRNYTIWGATAMILSELYQLIDEAKVRISLSKPYISSSNPEI